MNNYDTVSYFKVEIITPVHIGASKDKALVNGYDFVIENKQIYIMDLYKRMRVLREKFEKITTINNEQDYINKKIYLGYDLSNIQDINSITKTGTGVPFLPGSSLKGAIRSILFSKYRGNSDKIDEVLGKFHESLLRFFQIGDTFFVEYDTTVFNTKVFNLRNSRTNHGFIGGWKNANGKGIGNDKEFKKDKFCVLLECFPQNMIGFCRVKFSKTLLNNFNGNVPQKSNVLKSDNYLIDLLNLIRTHTQNHIKKNINFLEKYAEGAEYQEKLVDCYKEILELSEMLPNNSCLIRLGMGSGFHSITGDWKYMDYSQPVEYANANKKYKSRKFAFHSINGTLKFYPLGFVKLTLVSEEEYREYQNKHALKLKEAEEQQQQLLIARAQKQQEEQLAKIEAQKPKLIKFEDLKQGTKFDGEVTGHDGTNLLIKVYIEGVPQKAYKSRYPDKTKYPIGSILEFTFDKNKWDIKKKTPLNDNLGQIAGEKFNPSQS